MGYTIPGTAKELHERGIAASFTAVGLSIEEAAAYSAQAIPNVGWDASTNKQEAIITQKWTALNGYNNLEAYNEYRRTSYPQDIPRSIDPSVTGTSIPARNFYPASEFQQNATNVTAEGTINQFTSTIFWDVQIYNQQKKNENETIF